MPEVTGWGVVRMYEVNGDSCDQVFKDRFNNRTVIMSTPIKGLRLRQGSMQFGPGRITAEHRPAALKVKRGRTHIDKIATVK